MSVQLIIDKISKLVEIHEQLLKLSNEKTTLVKEGNVEELQPILVNERKVVQQLEKAEEERQKEVASWFVNHGVSIDEATLTNLLNHVKSEAEKKELEQAAVHLSEVIEKLKQQEELNMALIQQSMQFVQLSIDLLSPSLKNMNYGNDNGPSDVNRSVFDSKA